MRFLDGDAHEIVATLMNSIHNCFIPEIRWAGDSRHDTLMFLGTHAVMQTVTETCFGLRGLVGTQYYLKRFVDGPSPDLVFSEIAGVLHDLRNVTAHRWLSSRNHEIFYDYSHDKGWIREDGVLRINPDIYLKCFLSGFDRGGPIWQYRSFADERGSLIVKYRAIARWLELEKDDPICRAIAVLEDAVDLAAVKAQENDIKERIRNRFQL